MKTLKVPAAFLLGVLSAYVFQQVASIDDRLPETNMATLEKTAPDASQACVNPKYMYGLCVDQLESQICTICSEQLSE